MKDLVSSHWIRVVALVAAMSIACLVLVHYGYPWTGLALLSVAISAAVVVTMMRPSRSLSQLIQDVESEPKQPALKGKGTP
jgi:uncharacterized membrane protein YccC